MGLLDQLNEVLLQTPRKYWGDKATRLGSLLSDSAAMYGSANSPMAPEHANTLAGLLADFTPVVGDVKSAYDGMQSAREGDYLGAALGGLGALPLVPNLAGMIRSPVGRIPQTGAEARSLAEMLKRAGEAKGYIVTHEGSAISPSQYVTFAKPGDDAGEFTRQVRLSNHADKYPELASGVRTSVDPSTEVSFEQAVNWLNSEGFPTRLSQRYKDVPTWEQYYASRPSPMPTPTDDRSLKLRALREEWFKNPKGLLPQLEDVK